MSWIEKRNNCRCWIACWKQGNRKVRRSTGIRIEAGAAGRHARALAEQTAAAMEAASTGETPAHKAVRCGAQGGGASRVRGEDSDGAGVFR